MRVKDVDSSEWGTVRYLNDTEYFGKFKVKVPTATPGGDSVTSPAYYKFPEAEVVQISGHLYPNAAQALQYIARTSRIDGVNKHDGVEGDEDLEKAIKFLEFELERRKGARK